jgi:hypothetical protein
VIPPAICPASLFTGSGKTQSAVILSEAKNLSLFFSYTQIEERFFASLRMTKQNIFSAACSA